MPTSRRRPAALERVRRTPHLVVHWRGDALVLENYRTQTRVEAAPDVIAVLAQLGRWRDPASLPGLLPEYRPSSISRVVRDLVRRTILERESDAPVGGGARADSSWAAWHPAAGLLHFSSKNLAYQEFRGAQRRLRARAARQPRPPAVKRYPRAAQVRLPAPQVSGEWPRVLLQRRTWRRFSSQPVPLPALSTLLGLASRVQHWVEVPGVGRLPLKTYPSGGAQHPLEVYVLARRIGGLAPGLYHYAADAHRLERIRAGATAKQIRGYVPGQPWFGSAAALVIITAVFPRMQWKYAFARAYRAVLAESGHLGQNLCLTATWLGLAPFCTMALADSIIERDLGIDGVNESVLYVAGVGSRPPGADWAPWPTRRRLEKRPNRL